jgi:hypothetical protein
VFVSLT